MMSADFLNSILLKNYVTLFGIVEFEDCLPLLECRAASRIPKNAKSVISFAFPYFIKETGKRNLSYYASVKDYHTVITDILYKICCELEQTFNYTFVPFTDNSPIREVDAAIKAGLGVIGKNSLLITEKYGSFVFISEIITDMILPYTINKGNTSCLSCGLCESACPGNCIKNGIIDKKLCLSEITQKKGVLSADENKLIKNCGLAWGCDLCQTVCPMNTTAEATNIPEFISTAKHFITSADVPHHIINAAYGWRGDKVILRNLRLLEENY